MLQNAHFSYINISHMLRDKSYVAVMYSFPICKYRPLSDDFSETIDTKQW